MVAGNEGGNSTPTEVMARPRTYGEWRSDPEQRDEDAAHAFGYHLIRLCRDQALEEVPSNASPDTRVAVEKAVDTALHHLFDMLEGFWPLRVDDEHQIELALQVRVRDTSGGLIESREISPCKLDFPIGLEMGERTRVPVSRHCTAKDRLGRRPLRLTESRAGYSFPWRESARFGACSVVEHAHGPA